MKTLQRKLKDNWKIKIVTKKAVIGSVTYSVYVFVRTFRKFALIQKFNSLQEAKNYFNNLISK